MKTHLPSLSVLLASLMLLTGALQAQTIYVANVNTSSVASYDFDGTLINNSLVTGLGYPIDLAVEGNYIYVLNQTGTIGKYNLDGTVVNASLITGLDTPQSFAISGTDIYVADRGAGRVGHYSTTGATYNANLITGLSTLAGSLSGIAVSGTDLFVTAGGGTASRIYQYTTAGGGGTMLNTASGPSINELRQISLISGSIYYLAQESGWIDLYVHNLGTDTSTKLVDDINAANDVVVFGSNVLVASMGGTWTGPNSSYIGLYGLDGSVLDADLIAGMNGSFYALAVGGSPVPEPSTYAMMAGAAVLGFALWRRRQRA